MATHIKKLERYCEDKGLRLTDPRRFVLEIVTNARKPVGAYDILDKLASKLDNPKPATAYRAIDFLSEHGFIHRIESLNAYVSCETDHRHAGSQFMICQKCGGVTETHLCSMPESFQQKMAEEKFSPDHWNLEIHGLCATCH